MVSTENQALWLMILFIGNGRKGGLLYLESDLSIVRLLLHDT